MGNGSLSLGIWTVCVEEGDMEQTVSCQDTQDFVTHGKHSTYRPTDRKRHEVSLERRIGPSGKARGK